MYLDLTRYSLLVSLVPLATLGFFTTVYKRWTQQKSITAIFTGADGRASTSKFQFYFWTVIVVGSYVALEVARHLHHNVPLIPETVSIPVNLLIAMGLSIGTTVSAKVITTDQIRSGRMDRTVIPTADTMQGLICDDHGNPDLSKIQMMAWTFIAGGFFILAVLEKLVEGMGSPTPLTTLPDIPSMLLVLMGLGQGAYLGTKLVTTETPRLTGVSSPSGYPGSEITITGIALGENMPAIISLGDEPVQTPYLSKITNGVNEISFTVPLRRNNGILWTEGPLKVGVAVGGRGSANTIPFYLFLPTINSMLPSEAKTGTPITLYGKGFPANTALTVNLHKGQETPVPISATVQQGGTITFTLPAALPASWTAGTQLQVSTELNGYTCVAPGTLRLVADNG